MRPQTAAGWAERVEELEAKFFDPRYAAQAGVIRVDLDVSRGEEIRARFREHFANAQDDAEQEIRSKAGFDLLAPEVQDANVRIVRRKALEAARENAPVIPAFGRRIGNTFS